MERILLYYPTIEFPKDNWLRQAILYSDKISSILPFKDESFYPESLKYLIRKEEYSPIYIEDLIANNQNEYDVFADKFLQDVDNNKEEIFYASSQTARQNTINSLFSNKLSKRVIQELTNRGITVNHDGRIFMLENVAIYYMAGLAKFVSNVIAENLIIPSTDYTRFSKISFDNGIGTEQAINLIFENCLPIPDSNVELSDIIDFKKNNVQDLIKFRQFYIKTQNTLKNCRDSMDMKEALLSLKEKIDIELKDLNKLYSKNKIRVVYTSLSSLFGLDNPKLFNSLVGAGFISTVIDPKIGLGVGALLVGAKLIDSLVIKPKTTNEFSYLFKAQRQGIIQ